MLHVDLAHVFSEEFEYPAWDERDTGSGILHSLNIVQFHTGSRHLEASAAPPKDDRPSINELDEQPRQRGINQLSQHPPLYYAVAGTLERGVELVTGNPIGAFDVEAWFYRLVSILLVAPLPLDHLDDRPSPRPAGTRGLSPRRWFPSPYPSTCTWGPWPTTTAC